jgi:hypothetical protein
MRQPGCTACEALPGKQNCGGHWSTKTAVHTYGRRPRATLDSQEGNPDQDDNAYQRDHD